MPLAAIINDDLVTQPLGSVVRVGPSPDSCVLAKADAPENFDLLLGVRLADVAPAASGTISGFVDGVTMLLDGPTLAGSLLYLSAASAGVATATPPANRKILGIAYNTFQIAGTWYANVIKTSSSGYSYPTTNVDVAVYDVVPADTLLQVTRTATGPCTINLPPISEVGEGFRLEVKDSGNNCLVNHITLVPDGTDTVEQAATLVMNRNSMSLSFATDADSSDWGII